MSATKTVRIPKQTETDIAVLQVKVENIEKELDEVKTEILKFQTTQEQRHQETHEYLQGMKEASMSAHNKMEEKINVLEKWRWMMMGAGIALGALGHNVLGSLLSK